MNFRRFIFTALLLILSWQAAAITIDELQELNYSVYDSTGINFAANAAQFIEEHDILSDLDYAVGMWSSIDSLGCRTFIDGKINAQIEVPKYRYLLIGLETDPQQKVLLARQLTADFPAFSGGYCALVLAYLRDSDPAELNQSGSASNLMLQEDLPLFAGYGIEFPEDDYARLALIYYYILNQNIPDAKPLLRQAVDYVDIWLENYDLAKLVPMEDFHELQSYLLMLFKEKGADYFTKYNIPERANDLLTYYFEQIKDYAAVIEFFSPDPFYWESQYVIYGLTMSYYNTGDLISPIRLLTCEGDVSQARAFQDSWLAFDPALAKTIYTEILRDSRKDALHVYLCAHVLDLDTEKITQGRALVKKFQSLEYGYRLLTDIYTNYFGAAAVDDSLRQRMLSSLDKDLKSLRKYQRLFPNEQKASLAYLLWSSRKKDDTQALTAYKAIDLTETQNVLATQIEKIIVDFGRYDLLLLIREYEAQSLVDKGYITAEEKLKYTALPYCEALFLNGYYAYMLDEIAINPAWLDFPHIQFLLVNAHYEQQDYTKTIAMLRYMVEKGSIGTSTLIAVDDEALIMHSDWQPLLDYAATMPDQGAAQVEE